MSEAVESLWPLADAQPGQVVAIARWSPRPGSRGTIRAALAELVQASRSESGCLGYQAYHPDGADDGDIVLIERYAGQEALDAHRGSPHFRELALERILPLLQDRHVVITTVS